MTLLYPALKISDAVPINVNYKSPNIDVKNYSINTFHLTFTGTPVGSLEMQASLEQYPIETNWVDLPEFPIGVNLPNPLMFNYSQIGWYWIRIKFTVGAGSTGTMTVLMSGKT